MQFQHSGNPKPSSRKKHLQAAYVFGFFLLLLPLGLFYQSQQVIPLSSHQLFSSFRESDSLATATYANNSLQVSGVLYQKELRENNHLTLLLKTSEANHFIHCEMSNSQSKLVKELIPGMSVTVRGKCIWNEEKIFLLECFLVSP